VVLKKKQDGRGAVPFTNRYFLVTWSQRIHYQPRRKATADPSTELIASRFSSTSVDQPVHRHSG